MPSLEDWEKINKSLREPPQKKRSNTKSTGLRTVGLCLLSIVVVILAFSLLNMAVGNVFHLLGSSTSSRTPPTAVPVAPSGSIIESDENQCTRNLSSRGATGSLARACCQIEGLGRACGLIDYSSVGCREYFPEGKQTLEEILLLCASCVIDPQQTVCRSLESKAQRGGF